MGTDCRGIYYLTGRSTGIRGAPIGMDATRQLKWFRFWRYIFPMPLGIVAIVINIAVPHTMNNATFGDALRFVAFSLLFGIRVTAI